MPSEVSGLLGLRCIPRGGMGHRHCPRAAPIGQGTSALCSWHRKLWDLGRRRRSEKHRGSREV